MRTMILTATVLSALALGGTAEAKNNHCPPGLAKKATVCTPPGQAKKQIRQGNGTAHYNPGYVLNDYVVIRDPRRYDLDPRHTYYRSGDYVYRVNEDTREVINLIGAVSAILD